jgi:hypothetical protein
MESLFKVKVIPICVMKWMQDCGSSGGALGYGGWGRLKSSKISDNNGSTNYN